MDISHETVKYIVILLALVIIGYTIYLLYKDAMNTRSELTKTKSEISELTEVLRSLKERSEEDLDDEDDEDHEDYDEDQEDFDEDQEDFDDENSKDLPRRWNNNNILDQLILGSEQLQNLQQLQSEIEGTKLTEIKEENTADEDNIADEDSNIEFISSSENTKCESVLKSGKNKGDTCKRSTINNTRFCKIHQIEN